MKLRGVYDVYVAAFFLLAVRFKETNSHAMAWCIKFESPKKVENKWMKTR